MRARDGARIVIRALRMLVDDDVEPRSTANAGPPPLHLTGAAQLPPVAGADPRLPGASNAAWARESSQMQSLRSVFARCLAPIGASATAMAAALANESSVTPAASSGGSHGKVVHELNVTVGPDVLQSDFQFWLRSYLKELLTLPGMQGAKLLLPAVPGPKAGVVFVLGGPGAGKGTQSQLIVDKCGYTTFSAGDLLRAARKSGTAEGQMIDEYIKEGKIVPVEVTVRLLLNEIRASVASKGCTRFLVDGFPRNTNNLSGWQTVVGDELEVGGVLFYDCPEDVMEARLLERGKTSGRSDDNIESIKKRFRTNIAEGMPVVAYYEHQGLLHKIDGTRAVEDVWADSSAAIAKIEERFAAAAAAPAGVCLHLYSSTDPQSAYTDAVVERLAAEAAKRFGTGKVRVSGRGFAVDSSLKAFDLEALRAFD